MKKLFVLSLLTIIVFTSLSCKSNTAPEQQPTEIPTEALESLDKMTEKTPKRQPNHR